MVERAAALSSVTVVDDHVDQSIAVARGVGIRVLIPNGFDEGLCFGLSKGATALFGNHNRCCSSDW